MRRSPLGTTNLEVSEVGVGCNNFGRPPGPGRSVDLAGTRNIVNAALDAGINFFDTADIYGAGGDSERFLGAALQGRRDEAVVCTKFGLDLGDGEIARGRPAYVRRAVEVSLKRLSTDRIDVLYYHKPDGVTPLLETVDAMEALVRDGKVLALACSQLSFEQLQTVGPRIAALQNQYSLLHRDDDADVLPLCEQLGISYIPYYPLASGLLTGKHRSRTLQAGTRLAGSEVSEPTWDQIEALEQFASAHGGHTLLELSIGALLSQPAITSVIAGVTRPDQIEANVAAAGWRLAAEELQELAAI